MEIKDLIHFRKDPIEIKRVYQTAVLHVGATRNNLEKLKALLESEFDRQPTFKSELFGYRVLDNIEYRLKGAIKNISYKVTLEYIGCSVPFSMAHIHHASVKLPKGKVDILTPLIEQEFRKYEAELNTQIENNPQLIS